METKKEIAGTPMVCTLQINSKVDNVDTEKTIAKIADAYRSMYNRANQTLDVSRIDPTQITALLEELKKSNIQAAPVKSVMLESLNERMEKIVGKKDADSQPADSTKKKKKEILQPGEPLEPTVIKEEVEKTDNPFEEYDPYELLIGATVELEHTDNVMDSLKIAIDHLNEKPDYYSQLLTYVEPEFDPTDKLKGEEIEAKEYQTPGGSGINVGRMIKNMSRVHVPKFDNKRNMKDKFKTMFKMRSPKDDMNAAMQTKESVELQPGEWVESYTIVGKFEEEKEANDVLKALLNKKRHAQMLTDKDGKKVIVVEEAYKEDNTMGNSADTMGTRMPKKINTKELADEIIKKYKTNGYNN